jgi:hypothetical protein
MVIGLLSSGVVRAQPLTFFDSEASWLAAVSSFKVGTYPYTVGVTDSLRNVALKPDDICCIISVPPPIYPAFPPIVGANFTSVDITFSTLDLNNCLSPTCTLTLATDVLVKFPSPIYGFATTSALFDQDTPSASILFNGQTAPFLADVVYNGFFGVVGSVGSLDISCPGCNPILDESDLVSLPNIVVATIDEPSALASLVASAFLLAPILGLSRRHAA